MRRGSSRNRAGRETDRGFVPVRKRGKFPLSDREPLRAPVTDHSGEEKTLELVRDSVADCRVLLVDDLVAIGQQLHAAADLIEEAGGSVVAATVIRIDDGEVPAEFGERFPVHDVR